MSYNTKLHFIISMLSEGKVLTNEIHKRQTENDNM